VPLVNWRLGRPESVLLCQNMPYRVAERVHIPQSGSHSSNRCVERKGLKLEFYFCFVDILGPTCGLCALTMLFCGTPSIDELLKKAMCARYTNNGEMFSAKWLDILLKENLLISNMKSPTKVRSYLYDGLLDSEFIKEKLRQHCVLLVPYVSLNPYFILILEKKKSTSYVILKIHSLSIHFQLKDADKNNTPCKQNGHKAHWALIIGYLVDDFGDVS
jgi:hypothetical protein